ncbi:hypothetical protein SDC9_80907 [bioreactor metagenome]|uniref:Uncharacterized protein n=1 Tax=bioreactor metagenome TaxID=1076179 RepID=A0A644Z0B4_9ZZZZ
MARVLKPPKLLFGGLKGIEIVFGKRCGGVQVMSADKKIDRHRKRRVVFSQVDRVELRVNLVEICDNAPYEVDFIENAVLGREDVPQGLVAGVLNVGVSHHGGA